jgi:hypothetical protein
MTNSDSEGGCHATSSVPTQVSTETVVPSEPQLGSAGNLNMTELLPQ